MKKVAVYSFFESHNIGDILIAQNVKTIFSKIENASFFNVGDGKNAEDCSLKMRKNGSINSGKKFLLSIPFIGNCIHTISSMRSKAYMKVVSSAKERDVVIFAGGNLIMDLNKYFPSNLIGLYRAVKALKREGKKICFCFCGVGPFCSASAKRTARKILAYADFISVRDNYSFNLVKELLPSVNAELWCDPVLVSFNEREAEKTDTALGVNVYFGHKKEYFDKMENAFVSVVKNLRERYPDRDVVLFSSELTDIDNIKSVKAYFDEDSKVIVKNIESADELYELYKEVAAVIGTRMHTVITATTCGLPVVAISWQGKVRSLMELIDNSAYCFDIDFFVNNSSEASEKLVFCLENSESIVLKNRENIEKIAIDTTDRINNFFLEMEIM